MIWGNKLAHSLATGNIAPLWRLGGIPGNVRMVELECARTLEYHEEPWETGGDRVKENPTPQISQNSCARC